VINAGEGIQNLISNRALFCSELDIMGQKKVTEDIALAFASGMIAAAAAEENGISKRAQNTSEQLVKLWKKGAGNQGENRLDLFSAFTDYYTHDHSGRGRQQQFVSSEFGSGQRTKERVFDALRNDDTFAETVKRGEQLILVA
jgi:hypothetical protein